MSKYTINTASVSIGPNQFLPSICHVSLLSGLENLIDIYVYDCVNIENIFMYEENYSFITFKI